MIRSSNTPITATDEDSLVLLEALLASAPVGIAFLDGNLCIVRINEALARAVGCTVEECTGKSARELSPPALWPVIEPALRRGVGATGTSFTTGSLPRTMMTSSPASARAMSLERFVLAAWTVNLGMMVDSAMSLS